MDVDDPGHLTEHYNDSNRAFLQAFVARGTLTFKEAKPILAAIFTVQEDSPADPADITQEDFASYISACADALSPFDYEIRSMQHQVSKDRIYALVNSTSDALTQIATTRSTEEMLYVKRLLDAMFETFNTRRQEVMGVTSLQALKLARGEGRRSTGDGEGAATSAQGLTQSEAERTLERLVDEGWFERSKNGFFTLSPRGLLELRTWLVDAYNDDDPAVGGQEGDDWQRIKFCEACKDIVTIGQRCADRDCNCRIHDICQTAFWRSRDEEQQGKKCPRCGTKWDGKHFVGERAVTTTEAYLKGKRRSAGGGRSRGTAAVVADEEDEDDESDDGHGKEEEEDE
ncbi:hypothetical protein B7463_g1483, partial [Scytalidium lignicola]